MGFVLLTCIGKAVLHAIGLGVAGNIAAEIAGAVFTEWSKQKNAQERQRELEAVARASAREVNEQIRRILDETATRASGDVKQTVSTYLAQVPGMLRRSMQRPSDRAGISVPAELLPNGPEGLLRFLPEKLPRFKPGDRPLPGVDWELQELLGVGGFGEVWKARNPFMSSAKSVALKFCLDVSAAKVLRNEAAMLDRVASQGTHPGILSLQHTFLSADPPCLQYEFAEGGDLAGLVRQSGSLPAKRATAIVHKVAEIVGFTHCLVPPIVHRDLKPANILLQKLRNGKYTIRIADFGIGGLAASQAIKQTREDLRHSQFSASAFRGSCTPLYASPQQIRGDGPDPRDDVFSLGVIWYQLLTGDLTSGRPGGSRWTKRLTDQSVAPNLVELLEECFEENPEDRPANAAVLAARLGELLKVQSSPERPEIVTRGWSHGVPNAEVSLPLKQNRREEHPNTGEQTILREYRATRDEEIVRILSAFLPERGIYATPNLPEARLLPIRAKAGFFLDVILGLIDPCLVFCSNAIYSYNDELEVKKWDEARDWRTGQEVPAPKVKEGRFKIAYEEFANRSFEIVAIDILGRVGYGLIMGDGQGASVAVEDPEKVLDIFNVIKHLATSPPPSTIKDAMHRILKGFAAGSSLHVAPDIPQSKLSNAMMSAKVPENETILALLDCTTFGSAKERCLLFGAQGVYYCNWRGSHPGPGMVRYNEFPSRPFRVSSGMVRLGKEQILDVSNSRLSPERVVRLFDLVKGLVSQANPVVEK